MSKLVNAARRGDIETLKHLAANHDIDINHQEQSTGFTALHAAVAWGNAATVHWLLSETEIDIGIRDSVGRSAMEISTHTCSRSYGNAIEETILHYAVINAELSNGLTGNMRSDR